MHKRSFLSFIIVGVLLFSAIPNNVTLAATKQLKSVWEMPLGRGFPLHILPNSDGSIVHVKAERIGEFPIFSRVYKLDIMSIDKNGKVKKRWKPSDEDMLVVQTKKETSFVGIHYEKGTVTGYNLEGKEKWKYKFRKKIKSARAVGDTVYIDLEKKTVVLSADGKQMASFKPLHGLKYFEKKTGSFYMLSEDQWPKYTLFKYTKLGKLQWKFDFPLPKVPDGWRVGSECHIVNVTNQRIYVLANFWSIKEDDFGAQEEFRFPRTLYALDQNGKVLWTMNVEAHNALDYGDGTLVQEDGKIYYVDSKGTSTQLFDFKNASVYFMPNGEFILWDYSQKNKNVVSLVHPNGTYKWKATMPNDKIGSLSEYSRDVLVFRGWDFQTLYVYDKGKLMGIYKSDDPEESVSLELVDKRTRTLYVRSGNMLCAVRY
ncbi:hypothetical protein [Anoxybacillus gonensis]|uniref:hypothetical protein n=1 Tax=Anoxybacillus gonensis TaxID=198467 RepID=UPI0002BF9D49|nr:hypothetical protein [Anoxybacillus gonensis]EMI09555.1 hypothetical protein F510_2462 [Anoxybacillus gonensis]